MSCITEYTWCVYHQRGLVRTTGGKTAPKTKKNQLSGKREKTNKESDTKKTNSWR